MSKKNLVLRSFAMTVVLTSIFVLTIGAVLTALVIGDWLILKTGSEVLAWGLGVFVMLGFLCTLGVGVGIWIWFRGVASASTDTERQFDTMEKIIDDMQSRKDEG